MKKLLGYRVRPRLECGYAGKIVSVWRRSPIDCCGGRGPVMKKKASNVSTLPAPPLDGKRELRVVRTRTSEGQTAAEWTAPQVVHRVDVTGRSDREVEKIMIGMLRNMADEYHVEDSKDDK